MRTRKKNLYSFLRTVFVLYLILFSAFALFHAYENNELIDPHGCQIGQWVLQHGQGAVLSIGFLLVVLGCAFFPLWPPRLFLQHIVLLSLSARAPPSAPARF